jgi:hypothetical protein
VARCGAREAPATKIDAHLRGLIASATALAPAGKDVAQVPEDRQVLALRLEAWLNDWRETARVLVTRRDYRIALGRGVGNQLRRRHTVSR